MNSLEIIQYRILIFVSYRTHLSMVKFDHDCTLVLQKFRVPTIVQLHEYHDHNLAISIANNLLQIDNISQILVPRKIPCSIRNFVPFIQIVSANEYQYYSIVNCIRRIQNSIYHNLNSLSYNSFQNNTKKSLYKVQHILRNSSIQ